MALNLKTKSGQTISSLDPNYDEFKKSGATEISESPEPQKPIVERYQPPALGGIDTNNPNPYIGIDENSIREQKRKEMQATIDAINNVYNDMVREENRTGEGRLGQTRAINARSGLLGSDFGVQADEATKNLNKQQMSALENERSLKLQEAFGKIDELAQNEITAKKTEALGNWERARTLRTENVTKGKENWALVAQNGVDYDKLDEADRQKLLSQTGFEDETLAKLWYNGQKDTKDKIEYQFKTEGSKLFAYGVNTKTGKLDVLEYDLGLPADEMKGKEVKEINGELWIIDKATDTAKKVGGEKTAEKPVSVSPGESLVDPSTGKVIYTAPAKPADPTKPTTQTVGGDMYQWNPATNKWDKVTLDVTADPKKVDTAKSVIDIITNIKKDSALESAVGTISSKLPTLKGRTADFERSVERLKALLTLENMGIMKGVLSDADIKIITSAGTALDLNMSTQGFKDELKRIEDKLTPLINSANTGQVKDRSYYKQKYPQATDQEIDDLMRQYGQPFNQVGGDTNEAVSYLGNYNGVTGEGSSLWKHGLDVDLKKGDPVYSPVDGEVVFSGKQGGFGNRVGIKTAQGNIVYLSHNDALNVKVGDKVRKGQKVALGGNSGSTIALNGGDGSHLDITVKKADGSYFTPQEIKQRLS